MDYAGIMGTAIGSAVSATLCLLTFIAYLWIRRRKTVWNSFVALVSSTSFLIFLLALNGFLRIVFGVPYLWLVDILLYSLLVLDVYLFWKKGIGVVISIQECRT